MADPRLIVPPTRYGRPSRLNVDKDLHLNEDLAGLLVHGRRVLLLVKPPARQSQFHPVPRSI
jgi:hypothetical protein